MKKYLLLLCFVLSSAFSLRAEVPAYMLYTQDGGLPIYITTNGIAGGRVPFYQMKTFSNALPVIIKGVEGYTVPAGILTNINGIYFSDGSAIVTGGSLHVTGKLVSESGIVIGTNIEDKITLLAWQEDPLGSQVTQALVTVTNGWTMGPGLMWTNDLGTVTNEVTGLFTDLTNINAVMAYQLTVNSTNYDLFLSTNSFYHLTLGYDETLVDCASNALTTLPGTYLGAGAFFSNAVLTVNTTTNTPFLVVTNSTYTVITNTIYSTSNDFFYVLNGVTNSIAGGAGTTNASGITVVFSPTNYTAAGNAESHFQGIDIALPVISNAVITDAAARDTAQFANSVDWAGAVGVPYSTTTSGSNWFTSTTIPGLSFTTDISATGADFTAMPTSADTPDGSDPTALMNVDYLSVMLTNGFIHSLTNQLHILGVF